MGETAGAGDASERYVVVVNDEEQYSIWFDQREPPRGWHREGTAPTEAELLERIEAVWTDMRPRSLREHMAQRSER